MNIMNSRFASHAPVEGGGNHAVSVISHGASIAGDVTASNELWLAGNVTGNVRAQSIRQVQTGTVKGNIEADEALLAGETEGDVHVRILTLDATARIRGNLTYEALTVHGGADIEGRLAFHKPAARQQSERY